MWEAAALPGGVDTARKRWRGVAGRAHLGVGPDRADRADHASFGLLDLRELGNGGRQGHGWGVPVTGRNRDPLPCGPHLCRHKETESKTESGFRLEVGHARGGRDYERGRLSNPGGGWGVIRGGRCEARYSSSVDTSQCKPPPSIRSTRQYRMAMRARAV